MIFAILITTAGVLYALSFVSAAFFPALAAPRKIGILGGFALQSIALSYRIWQTDSIPVGTSYELLEVIVWFFVLLKLSLSKLRGGSGTEFFSMLPAAVLTLLPLGCPVFVSHISENSGNTASNFAAMHATLAAVSYAFMCAAAIAGAMFLAQRQKLKSKSHGNFSKSLPSLGALENSASTLLGSAAIAMAASAIMGTVSAFNTNITSAMYIKFGAAAIILILQISIYTLAELKLIGAIKLAVSTIVLAILSLLLLIPIELGL